MSLPTVFSDGRVSFYRLREEALRTASLQVVLLWVWVEVRINGAVLSDCRVYFYRRVEGGGHVKARARAHTHTHAHAHTHARAHAHAHARACMHV